jgi:hypothetical protein
VLKAYGLKQAEIDRLISTGVVKQAGALADKA